MATIFAAPSQSVKLLNPKTPLSSPSRHTLPPPSSISLSPRRQPFSLLLHRHRLHLHHSHKPYLPIIRASTTTTATTTTTKNSPTIPSVSPIHNATRTISSIFISILAVSNLVITKIRSISSSISLNPTPEELQNLQTLKRSLVCSIGPLFFAALKDRPSGYLNTPLTVVASGMAKWLDIYSGVLMVRVLLSWFPNIPWDRQPLSAIRDLCDPYLNLFRNIIPPIFDTLDVSPLLAFAVLGTLGSILNNSRGSY